MACYCNYLIVVNKEPDRLFDSIREKCFTIKETSAPEYFLEGDFESAKEPNTDNDILAWGYKTYVKCMMDNFNNTFGFDTSKKNAAIPPDYKPELYTTDLYNDSEKAQDWTCTGEMQWAINLSRIYII